MRALLVLAFAAVLAMGCARSPRRTAERDVGAEEGELGVGMASWYGGKFHGRLTANGERFNKEELTAAHRKLKFNTCVHVENLDNGREVEVRVNDRGPYAKGRIIDVSEAAARRLGFIDQGVARVRLRLCD